MAYILCHILEAFLPLSHPFLLCPRRRDLARPKSMAAVGAVFGPVVAVVCLVVITQFELICGCHPTQNQFMPICINANGNFARPMYVCIVNTLWHLHMYICMYQKATYWVTRSFHFHHFSVSTYINTYSFTNCIYYQIYKYIYYERYLQFNMFFFAYR